MFFAPFSSPNFVCARKYLPLNYKNGMCVQKSFKFSNIADKENCFLRKIELSENQDKNMARS